MAFLKRNLPRLRLGTRGSRLALIQAALVREALIAAHPDLADRIECVTFTTPGDEDRAHALDVLNAPDGGRGVFSDALDTAVLVGDWTSGDPVLGRFIQAPNSAGVPVYLYYRPGATEPEVLPQVLTPGTLAEL